MADKQEQLFNEFADLQALEAQKKSVLEIFLEVKEGIKQLNEAGVKIGSAKGIKGLSDGINSQKKAQDELTISISEYNKILTQNARLEAQMNAIKSEQGKRLTEQKLANRELNKEQQLRIKILKSEEGSIEQLNAKLERARMIYDKLGETQRNSTRGQTLLKYIQDTSKAYDTLRASTDRFQQRVGNYEGSAKIIVDAFERARVKMGQAEKQFGATSPEARAARGEFEALERITSQPQFLNISAKVGDANQELRSFTKQLIQMENAGLKNSDAYRDLQARLAQLTDQVQDTKQEIKALSSDTRNFDLFAGSVNFAADAFQTFAGAAALAGASEEKVQQQIRTLIAIQSVANGVKGIANELTTKGTAANRAYAFVQKQVNIVMAEGILTANGLKAAMGLLAVAATVVVGVVAIFQAIKNSISDAEQKAKNFSEVLSGSKNEFVEATKNVSVLRKEIDAAKGGFVSKTDVVKHYNETIGKTTGEVKNLEEAEKALEKNALAYIQFTLLKAAANLALGKAAEKAFEVQETLLNTTVGQTQKTSADIKVKLLSDSELKSLRDELNNLGKDEIKNAERIAEVKKEINLKTLRIIRGAAIKEDEKQKESFEQIADSLFDQAFSLSKKFKFDFFGDGDGDGANGGDILERKKKAILDLKKIELEAKAELEKQIIEIESFSFESRIAALKEYVRLKTEIINAEAEYEKSKKGLTAEEINLIETKRLDAVRKLGTESLELFKITAKDHITEAEAGLVQLSEADQAALDKITNQHEKALEESIFKTLGILTDTQKKALEDLKKAFEEAGIQEEIKNIYVDSFEQIAALEGQIIGGIFDRQKNRVQEQIDDIERLKNAEIDRINASGDNEEKKAARIKVVEAKAQADRERLELRQRQIDRQKAIAAKAFNVFQVTSDGIQAVNKARLAANAAKQAALINPLLRPSAALSQAILFQTIIASAAAAVQALAQPIPKFFRGKKATDAYEGLGIVGDQGRELGISRSGKISLFDRPTLTSLVKGDVILPNNVTEQILAGLNLSQMITTRQSSAGNLPTELNEQTEILRRIEKKQGIIIYNQPGIESSAYYKYHMGK